MNIRRKHIQIVQLTLLLQIPMETITLNPFEEWRCHIPSVMGKVVLTLEEGQGEMLGVELAPTLEYHLPGPQSTTVATYTGCTFSFVTEGQVDQKTYPLTNVAFNLHWALKANEYSNRLLVVGHKDTGKSSLLRTIAAYQQRTLPGGYLVNLDPHLAHTSVPSQLSVIPINDSILPSSSIMADSSATTHLNPLTLPTFPLVRSFGFQSPKSNKKLYKETIKRLASDLNARTKGTKVPVLVDTPPFTIGDWELIDEIINMFKITTLVVLDNDRFLNDFRLKTGQKHSNVTMLSLPKFENVMEKDPKFERTVQQFSIRSYFYGLPAISHPRGTTNSAAKTPNLMSTSVSLGSSSNTLNPYTLHISTSDLIFLRPIEHLDLNEQESSTPLFELVADPKEMDLVNSILVLIDDKNMDMSTLVNSVIDKSTIGLAYVQSVNDATKKLRLLIPTPVRTLPTKVAIITEMRYVE